MGKVFGSGGDMFPKMLDEVGRAEQRDPQLQQLLRDIRAMWDEWDASDGANDGYLKFHAFYHGFMAPYFGCYSCDQARHALKFLDEDGSGQVSWEEFAIYLKQAVNEHPDVTTAE